VTLVLIRIKGTVLGMCGLVVSFETVERHFSKKFNKVQLSGKRVRGTCDLARVVSFECFI